MDTLNVKHGHFYCYVRIEIASVLVHKSGLLHLRVGINQPNLQISQEPRYCLPIFSLIVISVNVIKQFLLKGFPV